MRDVYVIGTGLTPFGKFPDQTLADIGWPSARMALKNADLPAQKIEVMYCGSALGGMMSGQRVAKAIGLSAIPIINVENACSSSSSALRQAWMAIASGCHDTALVVGVEKLTKFGGGTLPLETEDWEVRQGMVMPALYAMRARRLYA